MAVTGHGDGLWLESLDRTVFETDLKQAPDIERIRDRYLSDTAYTLRFLSIALDLEEPRIFGQYMRWFGSLAFHLGFRISSMRRHFSVMRDVFRQQGLTDGMPVLEDTFEAGVEAFEKAYHRPETSDPSDNRFLSLLMDMRADKAFEHVNTKIGEGMTLRDVYLDILQPTLYSVGELWHQGRISDAMEHYITAAIQNIIGKLYPLLFGSRVRSAHTVTAVCAGDELHEIGMRMVAEFFEMSGRDTVFLGSNLPVDMAVGHLRERPTDVLAVSATTSSNLLDLKTLINTV
jgi:methanogenic corrinoid protein MtbC1